MAFLGQEEQLREFQDRFRYLYGAALISIAMLLLRLIHLQVFSGDRMRRYSVENRIKRVLIRAPRGMTRKTISQQTPKRLPEHGT
jgi:penicillin-binding protein 2